MTEDTPELERLRGLKRAALDEMTEVREGRHPKVTSPAAAKAIEQGLRDQVKALDIAIMAEEHRARQP